MKSTVLMWSIFASGFMGYIYDKVETTIGMEIPALLVGAIAAMVFGLYFELHAKSKATSEGES